MVVRESSYQDYGINDAQLKDILLLIRNDANSQKLFLQCCQEIKLELLLANQIWYSLTGRASYDDLEKIQDMLISKVDFYAYRRKAIARFYDELKKQKLIHKELDGQMHFDELKI